MPEFEEDLEKKLKYFGRHIIQDRRDETPIYVVITVRVNDIKEWTTRAVGWFPTFEEAKEIITDNIGDIYEAGYYKYALIEQTPPGLYSWKQEWWFEWEGDFQDGKYEPIEKPELFEHVVCFGLG